MAKHPSLFSDLPLLPALIATTRELGFERLTPIQAQAIPPLLAGKDLVGRSQTGSGKTAAFALPLLNQIDLGSRKLQGLVLCPTRELCAQVAGEIRKLGRRLPGLRVLVVSGGLPMGPQFGALEQGVHVVVGTPGRVLDHLRRRSLDLRQVGMAVLDEADRMLEMGFREDMESILRESPASRQTLLFSATFPPTIEALSRSFQRAPVERVTIADELRQPAANFVQIIHEVEAPAKLAALQAVLRRRQPVSAIVFCNLKANVAAVASGLTQAAFSAAALHGDLEQWERDRVMSRFRNGSIRVLVATDVAARGIDVAELDAVINYDLPAQPEIYVHRVGRTGRAGRAGFAASLCTAREWAKVQSIENLTGAPLTRESLPEMTSESVPPAPALMDTLRIAGGRKEKVRPGDILGALTGDAGRLKATDIGKIEIHDHHSFVAVATPIAPLALQRLQEGRIKGRRFRVERG